MISGGTEANQFAWIRLKQNVGTIPKCNQTVLNYFKVTINPPKKTTTNKWEFQLPFPSESLNLLSISSNDISNFDKLIKGKTVLWIHGYRTENI